MESDSCFPKFKRFPLPPKPPACLPRVSERGRDFGGRPAFSPRMFLAGMGVYFDVQLPHPTHGETDQ